MSAASESRYKRNQIASYYRLGQNASMMEAIGREAQVVPTPRYHSTTRKEAKRWMWLHRGEYETATELASAAISALGSEDWHNEGHWVWEDAADLMMPEAAR